MRASVQELELADKKSLISQIFIDRDQLRAAPPPRIPCHEGLRLGHSPVIQAAFGPTQSA